MLSRRRLIAGSLALIAAPLPALAAGEPVVIHMISNPNGSHVGFDPIGVLIQPGQRVRWVCEASVHTTTAYHPKNANHSLRIPKAATPWNSGYLFPGKAFEWTFTEPGAYDYFCTPHEMAGMVGRIIVGHASGPATLPFDYFLHLPDHPHWLAVPEAAQKAFPSISEIMQKRRVKLPAA
ncbi:MAG: plastocyanin/azurin family copper-binding protein [Acetobacteraceae bacterium]